jgi:signal transduction histidine kinase
VQQVLINLIGNAIKFSNRSSNVMINLILDKYTSYSDVNTKISIEVADEGIGMAKEDTANLFTPFFKSNCQQSREKNPNGNGLGLSICYKIAKSLNGDLTCVSTVGLGTIFRFSFMAEKSVEPEKDKKKIKKKNGSSK